MSMKTSDPLPDSNSEGMDLMAEHLSAERARGFRAAGLTFVQGYREGVRIGDLDGNEFINCRCSGGVFNFGHRPAFAIDALKHALDEFGDMGDWLLPSAVRARGAGALAGILPGDLRYSFFTPGGAEAVEVACKLARGATGRTEFVGAEHGYHGHIGFSLAMDEARDNHWFTPLVPGIVKVPFGDAGAVDRAVTDQTAAVCMETIPATAGYLVPPDDFWPRVGRSTTSAEHCSSSTRCRPDLAAQGRCGRASTGESSRTFWSPVSACQAACTRSPPAASANMWTPSLPRIRSSIPQVTADPSWGCGGRGGGR